MVELLRKVEGKILTNIVTETKYNKNVSGSAQQEDYINLYGFVGILQNLSQVEITSALSKPVNFGLPNENNLNMVTLEIDY